jgi:hypothetical protein
MKTGSGIQGLMEKGGIHREQGDLIIVLLFFKIRK